MRIQGRVVLITGASEGIGAATAREFEKRGARLSLIARTAEKLAKVGGSDTLRTTGDITNEETRRNVVERTIAQFGAIDILINNAGMGFYSPAWKVPIPETRALLVLNLFAPLALTQLVVPYMRERKSGVIVNISSIAGKVTLPWFTLYSVSKFALGSLTDGLRMELKRDGIHAMTVCPGYVRTDFGQHVVADRQFNVRPQSVQGVTAERVARAAYRGYRKRKREVVVPWTMIPAIKLYQLFPGLVEWVMARAMRNAR